MLYAYVLCQRALRMVAVLILYAQLAVGAYEPIVVAKVDPKLMPSVPFSECAEAAPATLARNQDPLVLAFPRTVYRLDLGQPVSRRWLPALAQQTVP
jgi:hypothetical protein